MPRPWTRFGTRADTSAGDLTGTRFARYAGVSNFAALDAKSGSFRGAAFRCPDEAGRAFSEGVSENLRMCSASVEDVVLMALRPVEPRRKQRELPAPDFRYGSRMLPLL